MDNINFRKPDPLTRRGSVGIVHELGWGPVLTPMEFTDAEEISGIYGAEADVLRDTLICAERVVCVRPFGGQYASCVFGRALYPGSGGNSLVVICDVVDGGYRVDVYFGSRCVSSQTVAGPEELCDDDYIVYDRSCELFATAGMPLSGGSDAALTDESYADAVAVLSDVDVIACGESSHFMTEAVCARVNELRCGGSYVRGLLADSRNGDGAVLSLYTDGCADAVYYTAGALAACPFYLTISRHPYAGSADVFTVSLSEAKELCAAGQMAYIRRRGRAVLYREVASDAKSGSSLRLCDELRRRIHALFDEKYRGRARTDKDTVYSLSDDIKSEIARMGRAYGCFTPSSATVSVTASGSEVSVSVSAAVSAAGS